MCARPCAGDGTDLGTAGCRYDGSGGGWRCKKVTLKFKDAAEETRGIGALTLKLQSNDDPSYEKKRKSRLKPERQVKKLS